MKRLTALLLVVAAALALEWRVASWWHTRPRRVIDAFHVWYHREGEKTYNNTKWLGADVQKSPLDLWVMQEILQDVRPDVLIEAGTYRGGSAYYFATLFDLMGKGRVVTVDIEEFPGRRVHPRILYLTGSSTSAEILARIRREIRPGERVLVDLDSDHRKPHVAEELRLYSDLVSPGSYLVVEDTHFNGHPILPRFGPGPGEAVRDFLPSHRDFVQDASREKFGMTFNPGGYLRRM